MIVMVSPDGRRYRLRWDGLPPFNSYGVGVLVGYDFCGRFDMEAFASLTRDGWRIECSTDKERSRVARAFEFAEIDLPDDAIVVRYDL
jgi:hypothetical protein